ncbi:MAG: rhodanese-like domain-containing protein [bacterium]|nr:rhodanese-like domain-containing protein [bacterium]
MVRMFMLGLGVLFLSSAACAEDLKSYLLRFDYAERKAMKIGSAELTELMTQGRVQLVDIRFHEEHEAWNLPHSVHIPLNELPNRLNELDPKKLVVTACPHKDRAVMARLYLTTKGFKAKYLEDGLVGLAEHLRGDRAKDFINNRLKEGP